MRSAPFKPGQSGFVAVEYALALGLILLPVALLVVTLPAWPERQTVARVVAEEAARAAVLEGDVAAGEAMAREVSANHGIDPSDITVSWSGSVARGADLTAEVSVVMPAVRIPAVLMVDAWTWTARHTESVDLYRSAP